jgi:sporulation protein YqfC
MKNGLTFSDALAERLELPGEALGMLKLSVVGDSRALVENHRGLLVCTQERVTLRGSRGSLSLYGEQLCIEAMNERELLLCGRLNRAEWEE